MSAIAEPKKKLAYHEILLKQGQLDQQNRLVDQLTSNIENMNAPRGVIARLDKDIASLKAFLAKQDAVVEAIEAAYPKDVAFNLTTIEYGRAVGISCARTLLIETAVAANNALEQKLAEKELQRQQSKKTLRKLESNLAEAEGEVKRIRATLKENNAA